MTRRMRLSIEGAFGQAIRELRKAKGLSQEELGLESGRHRTYISLLERGRKTPSLATVFEVARALGISASQLTVEVERRTGYFQPR